MKKINIQGINETIYHHKRKDGLNIYLWNKPNVKTYMASLIVNYGSIHDEFIVRKKDIKVPTGIAHYLEHLKFNQENGEEVFEFFKKTETDVNAFTTFEYTNYHIKGRTNLEKNITKLHNFVLSDYFTESLIDKERGIILEEAKMGLDNPNYTLFFTLLNNLFTSIKYRNEVIGSIEDIKKISLNDLLNVFNNFYVPNNMSFILTGCFDKKKVIKLLNKLDTKKSYKVGQIKESNEVDKVFKKQQVIKKQIHLPKVAMGFKINKKGLEKYSLLELKIYLSILFSINFGDTSSFKDEVIKKDIVNDFSYEVYTIENYITVLFFAEGENYKKIIPLIKDKLKNLDLSKDEFIREKHVFLAKEISSFDNIDSVNFLIQSHLIHYKKIISNTSEVLNNLEHKKIVDIANKLHFDNYSVVELIKK